MQCTMERAALGLAVVGAVNWGLVGLFRLDLVAKLLGGPDSRLSRAVYSLVGIAGGYAAKGLLPR
jgi:uncharacterized membrane protein YuzA (DUF378 family)